MERNRVFVLGAGQMGAGIAQVSIHAGYDTVLYDIEAEQLKKANDRIRKSLEKQEQKGKLEKGKVDEIMNRLASTREKSGAANCDILIEAAPENLDLKKSIFKEMDRICPEHAVLASNTSALSITKLGTATRRPEKVIGMHFINPVQVMPAVEVIRAYLTSDDTYDTVVAMAKRLKKEVVTAKDYPGFLSTRLIMPFINEALYSLYEGRGTKEDIDKCARLMMNHPMGPFEWTDFVGLDSVLNILTNLYESYGETKYFPCPLLGQMVEAGHLGQKTGRGFYSYPK